VVARSTSTEAPRRQETAIRLRAKRAEELALQIERDILSEGWSVGEHFGDEAQLIDRYHGSRAVIREAIQLVERHQVAVSRRGRGGGLIISAPAETSIEQSVVLYLEAVGISGRELLVARRLLELLAVRLATGRLTEAGIELLRAASTDEERQGICASDHQLHDAIVECAANPVIRVYLDALIEVTRRKPAIARSIGEDAKRAAPRVPAIHKAIADAIVGGNGPVAEQRMADHLSAIASLLEDDEKHAPADLVPAQPGAVEDGGLARHGDRAHSGVEAARLSDLSYTSLDRGRASDRVLQEMLKDVRACGSVGGVHLGSEAELMERYGASRAAFREAVRLLEHVGVVEMRRGTAGGLVVTEPVPDGLGRAIAMYLEHCGASPDDLQDVRTELELHSVAEIAGNLDARTRGRLAQIIRRERRAGDKLVLPVPQGAYLVSPATHFHLALTDIIGNRAVQVLARPLIAITSGGHARIKVDETGASARAAAVRTAHQRIIEAMLDGDRDLAVHRMRKHLCALSESVRSPQ
jgi:DNA-binding FadR family transcriptional regulator